MSLTKLEYNNLNFFYKYKLLQQTKNHSNKLLTVYFKIFMFSLKNLNETLKH